MGWKPSPWLLAQDSHIAWGVVFSFATSALHLAWWWVPVVLLLELVLKEGIFDQVVEDDPLFWRGMVDWAFYIVGALLGAVLIGISNTWQT